MPAVGTQPRKEVMKKKYIALGTTPLEMQLDCCILAGSVVTSSTVIMPAVQEKGIEIDMSQSGFNHEWE